MQSSLHVMGSMFNAFDLSSAGVEKTKALAEEVGVAIRVFQADLLDYELEEEYDVLFSTGVLHLVPPCHP